MPYHPAGRRTQGPIYWVAQSGLGVLGNGGVWGQGQQPPESTEECTPQSACGPRLPEKPVFSPSLDSLRPSGGGCFAPTCSGPQLLGTGGGSPCLCHSLSWGSPSLQAHPNPPWEFTDFSGAPPCSSQNNMRESVPHPGPLLQGCGPLCRCQIIAVCHSEEPSGSQRRREGEK